jgi:hypothetical protein
MSIRFDKNTGDKIAGATRNKSSDLGEIFWQARDYKPVFVPLRAIAIRLGRTLLHGSSDLPGSLTKRAASPPLFGLAPRGVCPASGITSTAVRFYRTISPLPPRLLRGAAAVYFLWHFP